MKKRVILIASLLLGFTAAEAQEIEEESPLTFSAGVRSGETWRGTYVCTFAGEGGMDFSKGGFSTGVAAVFGLESGGYNEIDLYASYSVKGAFLSLSDYSWTQDKFEYFGPYKNYHYLELGLGYDFSELTDLPLSVAYNVMLAGANQKADEKQAHASYLEVTYAPSLECGLDLSFTVGAAIENESPMYTKEDGFNFAEIKFGLSKTYNLKNFSTVTPAVALVCNPTGFEDHGQMFFTAGVSFGF